MWIYFNFILWNVIYVLRNASDVALPLELKLIFNCFVVCGGINVALVIIDILFLQIRLEFRMDFVYMFGITTLMRRYFETGVTPVIQHEVFGWHFNCYFVGFSNIKIIYCCAHCVLWAERRETVPKYCTSWNCTMHTVFEISFCAIWQFRMLCKCSFCVCEGRRSSLHCQINSRGVFMEVLECYPCNWIKAHC